jgi:tRNA A37 threonylcarbamoyladenosine synthetase subunit TsaC/SUA5/YrdC
LPSTILDCTGEAPVILRAGAVPVGRVQEVLGEVELGN